MRMFSLNRSLQILSALDFFIPTLFVVLFFSRGLSGGMFIAPVIGSLVLVEFLLVVVIMGRLAASTRLWHLLSMLLLIFVSFSLTYRVGLLQSFWNYSNPFEYPFYLLLGPSGLAFGLFFLLYTREAGSDPALKIGIINSVCGFLIGLSWFGSYLTIFGIFGYYTKILLIPYLNGIFYRDLSRQLDFGNVDLYPALSG